MNELFVVTALIPLGLMVFSTNRKIIQIGLWFSLAMALFCHGYFLSLHLDSPLVWGPVLAFFTMVVADGVSRKNFPLFTWLGAIFIAQALLAQDMGIILVLVAMADMFIIVEYFSSAQPEEKNEAIGNIYRSLISLCPAAIGVVLDVPPDIFPILVGLTIVLRLFSWPLRHWTSGKLGRIHQLIISAGSVFALWHILNLANHPEWAIIWFLVAAVLSAGVASFEVYLALNLGLFSISPALGVLGTAFWPLLAHQSKTTYFIAAGVGIIGALISNFSPHVFVENIDYVLVSVCALALARIFVMPRIEKRLWYHESIDIVLAIGLSCTFVYFLPLAPLAIDPLAMVFGGVFVLTFIVGLLLKKRKPMFFEQARPVALRPDRFSGFESLDEKPGKTIVLAVTEKRQRIFEMIESESHLIWLLGALGVVILWGRR